MAFVTNTFGVAIASFAVAWAALGFASGAHAEEPKTFKVEIRYDLSAPVDATYANIQKQARSACQREARSVQMSLPHDARAWVRSCTGEVVGKAVTAIAAPDLIAFHEKLPGARQIATR